MNAKNKNMKKPNDSKTGNAGAGWLPIVAIVLGLVLPMTSHAGKPGGGGSGTGTIYFDSQGHANAMNADGSGKTALPAGVGGTPSRLLHGGNRWFLRTANMGVETYPDGRTRRELFAIPEDGSTVVQLTNDPGLELLHYGWKWLPGEAAGSAVISGFARRWNVDGSVGFEAASVGLYAVELQFDGSGAPTAPVIPPAFLVSAGVSYESGIPWPDIYGGWDFSPDLSQVVADRNSFGEIRIITVATGLSRTLYSGNAVSPAWSPNGARIAFWLSTPNLVYGAIGTISPDGSGYKTNVKALAGTSLYSPYWSPDSADLLYTKDTSGGWNFIYDVYRVGAQGGSQVSLTSDLSNSASAIAWR